MESKSIRKTSKNIIITDSQKMKIIHLPTSVGGNSWGLSQAERKLGIESKVLTLFNNSYLNYKTDMWWYKAPPKNVLEFLSRTPVLLRKLIKISSQFNVYHLNYGSSIIDYPKYSLDLLDLPYLKKKGNIIATFNGCDARQKGIHAKQYSISACSNNSCYGGICNSSNIDEMKKRRVEKICKYASQIFAVSPDLFNCLPEDAEFLPGTIAEWDNILPNLSQYDKYPLKIVHAPTNRGAKGSEKIISILKEIDQNNPGLIDINIVENVPYQEALGIYAKADIVIDQILIGWYGNLAIEAMKMGKPVLVYIREDDLRYIPSEMGKDCMSTLINVNENNLKFSIEYLIENRTELKKFASRSQKYVEKWHNPMKIAQWLIKNYY